MSSTTVPDTADKIDEVVRFVRENGIGYLKLESPLYVQPRTERTEKVADLRPGKLDEIRASLDDPDKDWWRPFYFVKAYTETGQHIPTVDVDWDGFNPGMPFWQQLNAVTLHGDQILVSEGMWFPVSATEDEVTFVERDAWVRQQRQHSRDEAEKWRPTIVAGAPSWAVVPPEVMLDRGDTDDEADFCYESRSTLRDELGSAQITSWATLDMRAGTVKLDRPTEALVTIDSDRSWSASQLRELASGLVALAEQIEAAQ